MHKHGEDEELRVNALPTDERICLFALGLERAHLSIRAPICKPNNYALV